MVKKKEGTLKPPLIRARKLVFYILKVIIPSPLKQSRAPTPLMEALDRYQRAICSHVIF